MAASPATRRRRRSSEDVRALLLEAARELFSVQGFDGTSTKEIAAKAGVSEGLLFTNFTNKSQLFTDAVIGPFSDLVADYAELWERDDSQVTPEERVRTFIGGLYDLAERNRALLLSAVSRYAKDESVPEAQLIGDLGGIFERMLRSPALQRTADRYDIDIRTSLPTTTGMVLGVVLLDTIVFPKGARRPSRARLIDEMTSTILDHVERSSSR